MADKDLTRSPKTSNLEAETTKNMNEIDDFNKESDTEESKKDDSQEKGFLGKGNQGAVKRRSGAITSSAQHEKIDFAKKHGDLEHEEASDGAGDISTNMEELEVQMREFGCKDESYRLKNEEDDVKLTNVAEKDLYPPKKGLMEWLRGYVELDEDWEAIKEIKAEVVKAATDCSHLLVNLMFSLPKIYLVDTMFQGFFDSLKDEYVDENSKLIHRILILLESAYEEEKKLKTLKEVDALEEYSDTDQNDEFRGSELREPLFEGSQFDDLIVQFLNAILCLENTLFCEGEPDREILVKDFVFALEHELKECEEDLKRIASRIDELKAEYGCVLWPEDQNICEMMELKIDELWNQELEAEETKTTEAIAAVSS